MISKDNFKELLITLGFRDIGNVFTKKFPDTDYALQVDFKNEKFIYPEGHGLKINERQTCNFSQRENFIVFECVHRLLEKGYKPEHIELEPKWKVGHGASGGRADIMVKDNSGKSLLIIECKTEGKEYDDAWKKTLNNVGQLFSYVKQAGSTQFICLYTSEFVRGKVVFNYYLVTLKDNEKLLLELADKSPLSYEKAKGLDVEDIFTAWKETYRQDYATKGIFEDDIPPYEIGKTKYTLKDLKSIIGNDIQGKYHQFATILRQHNVSGRENAFDKLVNLFLCKIVDETNNPEELKFYWRGIAYDDHFSLIDRLQKLYQDGMQRFLGEDVIYISADQIDTAFDFFKDDPDATKDIIKKYFKELKFFNNNDFGFIDVHNEKLFYQNTAILLKIVQMLQDIRLKTDGSGSEENQFLGDMFEGFLDQGVKQSEGQFFTPMPIVKFILKSLPLNTVITQGDEIPKVIDFACGAGHFLNEYAKEIKPIVEQEKEAKITDYYANVFGVEKEYRLSKVAKVSAFMYGQDNINIVYADALSTGKAMDDRSIKDNSFSVLVANPPYSVKGFLETLSEIDRKKYKLIDTVSEKAYPNNNSIEAFFIERAKQLLKPSGVAAIIVPSSILTKGKAKSTSKATNLYVATREVLLKYFDFVAITEFGSGTFGKTSTNTVTLFIRRKKENPAPADHFYNRVNAWFNSDKSKNELFKDSHLLSQYCMHLGIELNDYQTLFDGKPNDVLLKNEIFLDYKKEFENWVEIKSLKNKKTFKYLSKDQQNFELEKRFVDYVTVNEKEKVYYFLLASQNPNKVLIIKSPSKSNEMKEFLGYEWSSAKGNEGIKYLGGVQFGQLENDEEEDVDLDDDDKRVLSNIFNLDNIKTPLYDPHLKNNTEKINDLISRNFMLEEFTIPESLKSFVSESEMINMIDFASPNFNKGISLSPKRLRQTIETKWDLIKLGKIAPYVTDKIDFADIDISDYISTDNLLQNRQGIIQYSGVPKVERVTRYLENDILISNIRPYLKKIWFATKSGGCSNDVMVFRSLDPKEILPKYLFYILSSEDFFSYVMSDKQGVKMPRGDKDQIVQFLIPKPDKDVQLKIIDSCSKIDVEAEKAKIEIVEEHKKIQDLISDFYNQGHPLKKISDLCEVNLSKSEIKNLSDDIIVSFVEMASVSEKGYITQMENRPLKEVRTGSYRYFSEGDIILAKITPCMENGKCAIATGLTNNIGFGSSEFHVFRVDQNLISNYYLFAFLNREEVRIEAERNMTGSSGHRRVPETFYKKLEIPVPIDYSEQTRFLAEIDRSQKRIDQLEQVLKEVDKRKQKVIGSYLTGEKK